MKTLILIPLDANVDQVQRLKDLQAAFAKVCNALAPMVQSTRCWNRVALHHMAYRSLREQFPEMGSQMVCNAIYSVSRASRQIYQHPQSEFNIAKLGDRPLPLLQFEPNCPVYFDRHTLSIKGHQLSMYTLDGRMRFDLDVAPEVLTAFAKQKLREMVLKVSTTGGFEFSITMDDPDSNYLDEAEPATDEPLLGYVVIEEGA